MACLNAFDTGFWSSDCGLETGCMEYSYMVPASCSEFSPEAGCRSGPPNRKTTLTLCYCRVGHRADQYRRARWPALLYPFGASSGSHWVLISIDIRSSSSSCSSSMLLKLLRFRGRGRVRRRARFKHPASGGQAGRSNFIFESHKCFICGLGFKVKAILSGGL
jgi:hypothetical protein